jgi:FixJ family two-component response regulator
MLGGVVCRNFQLSATATLKRKSNPLVILVEDDASVRRALQRLLLLSNFKVSVFESAEAMLNTEIPTGDACLLLDVYMPGMSGIELYRKMRESRSELPTILMSGRSDEDTARLMREAKPAASLFKPFDEKTLLGAIRKALRKRSN